MPARGQGGQGGTGHTTSCPSTLEESSRYAFFAEYRRSVQ